MIADACLYLLALILAPGFWVWNFQHFISRGSALRYKEIHTEKNSRHIKRNITYWFSRCAFHMQDAIKAFIHKKRGLKRSRYIGGWERYKDFLRTCLDWIKYFIKVQQPLIQIIPFTFYDMNVIGSENIYRRYKFLRARFSMIRY